MREMGVIELEKDFKCHAKTCMYSFREEAQGRYASRAEQVLKIVQCLHTVNKSVPCEAP